MGSRDGSGKGLTLLGLAVAALSFLVWHLAFAPVDLAPLPSGANRPERRQVPDTALATPLDKKPALAFREIAARPLFVPDRKPVRRDEPPTSAGMPVNMRLVGVVKVGDEPGRALIRIPSEAKGKWITEGEQFDGWKLRQVTERSAIVESGGRSHELTLPSVSRPAEGEEEHEPESPAK